LRGGLQHKLAVYRHFNYQALEFLKPDGSLPTGYIQKIRERKYELSLLTKIFLGKAWTLFFSLATLASMYGNMRAYCTIFANSFENKFHLGEMLDGGYVDVLSVLALLLNNVGHELRHRLESSPVGVKEGAGHGGLQVLEVDRLDDINGSSPDERLARDGPLGKVENDKERKSSKLLEVQRDGGAVVARMFSTTHFGISVFPIEFSMSN
jgi:hypothetical protein